MTAGLYTHPELLRHETGPRHPERPNRLRAIEDQLIASHIEDLLVPYEAPPAIGAQLCRVHCAEYVRELVTSVPIADYVPINPGTSINPHTYMAAVLAVSVTVDATDKVIVSELESAFYSVHPSGYHTEPSHTVGFRFFNNVTVTARHALEYRGLQHMVIAGLDAHHGSGAEVAFYDEPRVLMCGIFQHLFYPYSGTEVAATDMVDTPLPTYADGPTAHGAVEAIWLSRLEAPEPEMLSISADFDAHRKNDLGQMGLVEADYAWTTKQLMQVAHKHARSQIVSCLEDGRNPNTLDRSVAAHTKAFAELQTINSNNSLMSFEKAIETSRKNRFQHAGPALH